MCRPSLEVLHVLAATKGLTTLSEVRTCSVRPVGCRGQMSWFFSEIPGVWENVEQKGRRVRYLITLYLFDWGGKCPYFLEDFTKYSENPLKQISCWSLPNSWVMCYFRTFTNPCHKRVKSQQWTGWRELAPMTWGEFTQMWFLGWTCLPQNKVSSQEEAPVIGWIYGGASANPVV
jgi:hypothetical protein